MKGTSNEMILDYFRTYGIAMGTGVCFAGVINVVSYQMFSAAARSILLVASIVLLIAAVYRILASFDTFACLMAQRSESGFIEKAAVRITPQMLHFPEKKRNLIYIFLESMESTFSSKEEGGAMEEDCIPELTALAKEGVNFSRDEKLGGATPSRGASWTTGAMVSQTCGYPLMISLGGKNYQNEKNEFMPGAVAIGDVLKKEGYTQKILVGSDLTFGGRKMYFEQHGEYEVYDYPYAKEQGKIPKDYYEWWGFEDKKLFAYAKEEIEKLAKGEKPFNFTLLTVDTHHIGGYVCEDCHHEFANQYDNVLACSSKRVKEFVDWLKAQDFYKDTTIVISGDHCTMDNNYICERYDGSVPRKVYSCILNSVVRPTREKNRNYYPMDMYPTTLAAMGVQIEGERIGLGTNLFSDKETLLEKYGDEKVQRELAKGSSYYREKILGEKKK
ncbi:MAG: LTA synthase family protein [Eubacterium sp.]